MPTDTSGRTNPVPSDQQIAGGVLAGQAKAVADAGKPLLKDASRVTRLVAKTIPGLPGLVFDAAGWATAENKDRASAEFVGQVLGGGLGALGGPVGVAIGSTAGAMAGEYLYDHRDEIRAGMAKTKAWIDERNAETARGLIQGFENLSRPPAYRRQF